MLVGYARISTQEHDLALQLDALKTAGCSRVFEEKASGAQRERPALQAALEYMRQGDTLVVWRLDHLARSLKQLIETVEGFGDETSACVRSPKRSTPPRPAASWSSTRSTGRRSATGSASSGPMVAARYVAGRMARPCSIWAMAAGGTRRSRPGGTAEGARSPRLPWPRMCPSG